MEAAAPRISLLLMKPAAPRYAPVAILLVSKKRGGVVRFLDGELFHKVDYGVELEEEGRLVEGGDVETLEDGDDCVDMSLFNDK